MLHTLALSPWDKRKISPEDLSLLYPLNKEQKSTFRMPSIRAMADDDTRAWISTAHGLPIDTVLYAIDMELWHIHDEAGRLLFTKNSKKPRLAQKVTVKGQQEWRFWPQQEPGISLRRDDYVLFRIAVIYQRDRATFKSAAECNFNCHLTLERLCIFYPDRYQKHRF